MYGLYSIPDDAILEHRIPTLKSAFNRLTDYANSDKIVVFKYATHYQAEYNYLMVQRKQNYHRKKINNILNGELKNVYR